MTYDPNQPRVPKGDPRGGQWTSDGSGAGSAARDAAGLKSRQLVWEEKFADHHDEFGYVCKNENADPIIIKRGNR